MADFRTHAAFGVGLGAAVSAVAATLGLVSGPMILVPLFFVAALGAMAPDIDSDSGVPFHVAFGALSIIAGGAVWSAQVSEGVVWNEAALFGVGTAAAVWIVVGGIFKRLTTHRGMAHSLPAALLAGLSVFFVGGTLSYGEGDAFLLGTAALLGYLAHLVLDEAYAAVDFSGHRFLPSRSLGSALKLASSSWIATVTVYLGIVSLLLGNVSRLFSLTKGLWKAVV
ncbi:MAG: hypothetical protein HGA38_02745 [Candidatus Moranbacteria bacterium]|nr:hypothetical protein [Candidatus Moranbacteria bacterium]